MEEGSYTLVIEIEERALIEVGALGELEFEKGFYCYHGSAQGSGGFKRVDRHIKHSRDGGNNHWHIDHLTSHPSAGIVAVFKSRGDLECVLSRYNDLEPVEGFGCSDCRCPSHLFYSPEGERMLEEVRDAHRHNSGERPAVEHV